MARRRRASNPGTAHKVVAEDLCGLKLKPAGEWAEDDRDVRAFRSNPFDQLGERQVAMSLEALQGIYDAIPFGERVEFSDGRYGVVDVFYPPRWDDEDATTGAASFGIDVDLFQPSGTQDGHIEFIVRQEGWETPVKGRSKNPGGLTTTILVLAAAAAGYVWGSNRADPELRFERAMEDAGAAVRAQDWAAASDALGAAYDAMPPAISRDAVRAMESLNNRLPQRDRLIALESNPAGDLVIDTIQVGPAAYEMKISGKVGRVQLRGRTLPVYIGMYEPLEFPGLAHKILLLNRDGGRGGKVPFATRRKVEAAVAQKIAELHEEADGRAANPSGAAYIVPENAASLRRLKAMAEDQEFAIGKVSGFPDGPRFTRDAYYVVASHPYSDVVFWIGEAEIFGWWYDESQPHAGGWAEMLEADAPDWKNVDPYVAGIIDDADWESNPGWGAVAGVGVAGYLLGSYMASPQRKVEETLKRAEKAAKEKKWGLATQLLSNAMHEAVFVSETNYDLGVDLQEVTLALTEELPKKYRERIQVEPLDYDPVGDDVQEIHLALNPRALEVR